MKRNRLKLVTGALMLSALTALGGCAGTARTSQPADPAAGKTMGNEPLAGKVVETLDAGGYTYICLEKDGKKTWAAVPTMKVTVGEDLALLSGAEMGPFTSKVLNRTFDQLIFSGGPVAVAPTSPAGMPPGHPAMTGPAPAPKMEATTAEPGKLLYAGKVVETMNSGGYTYILLEKNSTRSWAAIALTTVNVGDEVELLPGNEMGSFRSKSLNRTFDNIVFSQGLKKK